MHGGSRPQWGYFCIAIIHTLFTLFVPPQAPEVILCPQKDLPHEFKDNEELTYTGAIDIWAVGVLSYELMTGRAPFERKEGPALTVEEQTCSQILGEDPAFPPHLSPCAVSFIRSAMAKDPDERPSVDELLYHPFLEPYQASLKRKEDYSNSKVVSLRNPWENLRFNLRHD